jgi:phage tail sheath protein FI
MKRLPLMTLPAMLLAVAVVSAAPDFKSVWRSQDASQVSFAGKKVAALLITQDDSLRMSGEEALVRELTARGLEAVATYRMAPKEELQSAERARRWFERANVEGVIALRPVSSEQRLAYNDSLWMSPSYNTFWGYYGYSYTSVVVIGAPARDTVITVESLIFSVPRNQLLWAAVSETRNPKTLQKFVADLVKESVKQLQKQGLAKQ